MTESENALALEFDTLRESLIKHYDEKRMRASGNWAKELEARVEGLSASIWGLSYSDQLEHGRTPTSSSPKTGPITLRQAIEAWIDEKNITPKDDISTSSLAFLIARKIHREGWSRDKYDGTKLISEVITPQLIQGIIDRVSYFQISTFSSEIIRIFRNTA